MGECPDFIQSPVSYKMMLMIGTTSQGDSENCSWNQQRGPVESDRLEQGRGGIRWAFFESLRIESSCRPPGNGMGSGRSLGGLGPQLLVTGTAVVGYFHKTFEPDTCSAHLTGCHQGGRQTHTKGTWQPTWHPGSSPDTGSPRPNPRRDGTQPAGPNTQTHMPGCSPPTPFEGKVSFSCPNPSRCSLSQSSSTFDF